MSLEIEQHKIDGVTLRVARTRPTGATGPPLLLFNGIGASLELLEEFASGLEHNETIAFDMPGVGGSQLAIVPRRPWALANMTSRLLDRLEVDTVDVFGVSWGGMLAQQFAHQFPERSRRLILAATSAGQLMVPAMPHVLVHMITPFRHTNKRYFRRVAGTIYGGDFRNNPELARKHSSILRPPKAWGYLQQLFAISGWTSMLWLHRLKQRTLVMAGTDDPIVPGVNARILARRIPEAELVFYDCGHMFVITRQEQVQEDIRAFLAAA